MTDCSIASSVLLPATFKSLAPMQLVAESPVAQSFPQAALQSDVLRVVEKKVEAIADIAAVGP
jgi:hypothetical protein